MKRARRGCWPICSHFLSKFNQGEMLSQKYQSIRVLCSQTVIMIFRKSSILSAKYVLLSQEEKSRSDVATVNKCSNHREDYDFMNHFSSILNWLIVLKEYFCLAVYRCCLKKNSKDLTLSLNMLFVTKLHIMFFSFSSSILSL